MPLEGDWDAFCFARLAILSLAIWDGMKVADLDSGGEASPFASVVLVRFNGTAACFRFMFDNGGGPAGSLLDDG